MNIILQIKYSKELYCYCHLNKKKYKICSIATDFTIINHLFAAVLILNIVILSDIDLNKLLIFFLSDMIKQREEDGFNKIKKIMNLFRICLDERIFCL